MGMWELINEMKSTKLNQKCVDVLSSILEYDFDARQTFEMMQRHYKRKIAQMQADHLSEGAQDQIPNEVQLQEDKDENMIKDEEDLQIVFDQVDAADQKVEEDEDDDDSDEFDEQMAEEENQEKAKQKAEKEKKNKGSTRKEILNWMRNKKKKLYNMRKNKDEKKENVVLDKPDPLEPQISDDTAMMQIGFGQSDEAVK